MLHQWKAWLFPFICRNTWTMNIKAEYVDCLGRELLVTPPCKSGADCLPVLSADRMRKRSSQDHFTACIWHPPLHGLQLRLNWMFQNISQKFLYAADTCMSGGGTRSSKQDLENSFAREDSSLTQPTCSTLQLMSLMHVVHLRENFLKSYDKEITYQTSTSLLFVFSFVVLSGWGSKYQLLNHSVSSKTLLDLRKISVTLLMQL